MNETGAQIIRTSNCFDNKFLVACLSFCLIFLLHDSANSQKTWDEAKVTRFYSTPKFDEAELKSNFDEFINGIDSLSLTKKYPEIVRKILSHQPREQETALKMLARSQDIDAIPWILLLLDSEDKRVQTYAGYSLQEIVSSDALNRRDLKFPRFTVLKPLPKNAAALKPMAWIVLKLLRNQDPSLIAYAMTMARYLNLYEFEDEITKHRDSVHPAVTNTMKWAIEELGLQKKYESNELKKEQ